MKLFQKLVLFALLVMVGSVEVKAADVILTKTDYVRQIKLSYQSVNVNNEPITLSEMVYVNRYYNRIDKVLVHNHPTTTSDELVPTGSDPQIFQVMDMCDGDDRCLVVCPDYLGYGVSKGKTHPYMCSMITARNIVDGVCAAIDYVKTQKNERAPLLLRWKCDDPAALYNLDNYSTLNVGYSQGGAAALAVHKYIETEASDEVKKKINLEKTICGAGPHSQTFMFDAMEHVVKVKKNGEEIDYNIEYPLYLPYTIDGLLATYGNSTMRGITEKDIYTDKLLKSNALKLMRQKNTVAAELNRAFIDELGTNGTISFYDLIRPEYADRSSKLYRTVHKALKQCDLLEGWKPVKPIIFYHYKGDEVVPYNESEMAYEKFKAMGCDVSLVYANGNKDETGKDIITGLWAGADILAKLGGNLNLDPTHMGYGTRFYLSIFSGNLR